MASIWWLPYPYHWDLKQMVNGTDQPHKQLLMASYSMYGSWHQRSHMHGWPTLHQSTSTSSTCLVLGPSQAPTIAGHLSGHTRYSATVGFRDKTASRLGYFGLKLQEDGCMTLRTTGVRSVVMHYRDLMQWCGAIQCFGVFSYLIDDAQYGNTPLATSIFSLSLSNLLWFLSTSIHVLLSSLSVFHLCFMHSFLQQSWLVHVLASMQPWISPGDCKNEVEWVCSHLKVCCSPWLLHSFDDVPWF